ncbi:core-binding factor subunit beta-like isoform X2 [Xenia sp. Carnegie-2017]|uniref:core-binding factor subunit beta-like isoform X2 n=1 Tax=Xenia sp. Carnegie-2017 TaxID=2897299 RepID=UPI001F0389EC|nr:core-binding factor subunit beta-like isoform X2 [Xenia sp. Carnegie-2017]
MPVYHGMPRVVDDQRNKFQTDSVIRQLHEDCEVRYIDNKECNVNERCARFRTECMEGKIQLAVVPNGVHLLLSFPPSYLSDGSTSSEFVDFQNDTGKVRIKCPLIFNGVCVKFVGWLDNHSLVGAGHLEFDEASAEIEHQVMTETVRKINMFSK